MLSGNWRLAIYRWNQDLPTSRPIEITGRQVLSLPLPSEQLNQPFDVQFENALQRLEQNLDAYVEGDGAFGASGKNPDGTIWKLQGTIFEVDFTIRYAELWLENCAANNFEAVLNSLLLEKNQCVVQLMERGCFVSCIEFFRIAFGES